MPEVTDVNIWRSAQQVCLLTPSLLTPVSCAAVQYTCVYVYDVFAYALTYTDVS